MTTTNILISLIIGLGIAAYVIYSIYETIQFNKYRKWFHSQMVPGTKLRVAIADLDDPEDVSVFNATVVERKTDKQIIMEWGDKKQTQENIDWLIHQEWEIVND